MNTPDEHPGTTAGEIDALRSEVLSLRIAIARERMLRLQAETAHRKQIAEMTRAFAERLKRTKATSPEKDLAAKEAEEAERAAAAAKEEADKAQRDLAALEGQRGDTTPGGGNAEGPTPTSPPKPRRHEHGRAPRDMAPGETTRQVPCTCGKCGSGKLDKVRTEVSKSYDYVPGYWRLVVHERVTVRCRECSARTTPPLPPMPFERVSCSFLTLASIAYMVYGMSLPLDRMQRDAERQGIHLASSTLTRWGRRAGSLLMLLADAIRVEMLANSSHLCTDGTGTPVVFPRLKANPRKGDPREGEVDERGYLIGPTKGSWHVHVWASLNTEDVCYHGAPDKSGPHNLAFLTMVEGGTTRLWTGRITSDAASTNNILFGQGRSESGCNAHGVMGFTEAANSAPAYATEALAFLSAAFDIERKAKESKLSGAELLRVRQLETRPIMERFREWLTANIHRLLPSNPVRVAMQYYLNHWGALTAFLADPLLPIDNNLSERLLRAVDLFRNNSMFAGGEEGVLQLCAALTVIRTCLRRRLDPIAYMAWGFERLVPHPQNRGIKPSALTPSRYKAWLDSQAATAEA